MQLGTMLMPTGQPPKAAVSNHSLLQRATRADVKRIIGARLIKARELNGLTQTDAAVRFGYKTPAQLCQWEMGRRIPPIEGVVRASAIYRVSVDFLLGVSPEPDRDPHAAVMLHVLEGSRTMVDALARTLAEAVVQQTKMGGPTVQAAYAMTNEGAAFLKAFDRFVELNQSAFEEDMRGSDALAQAARSFRHNGLQLAKDQIERYERVNAAATRSMHKKLQPLDDQSGDLFSIVDA